MEQHFKLNWLAAGEIVVDGQFIQFDRVPHMALVADECLLIAGARDHGIVAVNHKTGLPLFFHNEHRGRTVGVLVDRKRVFIVTLDGVSMYLLRKGLLERMAPIALSLPEEGELTNAMAIDTISKLMYLRHSTGTAYRIYVVDYHTMEHKEICLGAENTMTTITQLCHYNNTTYGVQGAVGTLVNLARTSDSPHRVHGSVISIDASSNCLVTTQLEGQGLTLWTPDCSTGDQFRTSLPCFFPNGQDMAVLLDGRCIYTFHAAQSLLHVFEWRAADEPLSERATELYKDPLQAHINDSICRYMGKPEVMTAQELITMILSGNDEEEDLVTVSDVPAAADTICGADGTELVDVQFFRMLDTADDLEFFGRWVEGFCAGEEANILEYLPEVVAVKRIKN